jgi:hypothetical protein
MQTASRSGSLARPAVRLAVGLAIVVVSFLPRALTLDRGFMIDEALWLERSDRFVSAITDARFGDAYATGHPGVTTSWIAGIAQRTLPADASLRERYARARLGMAIANVALLLLLWLLARPLLGELAAAAGTLLLSLDPVVLAHTRVLQLDGFQTLAMVAAFVALMRASRDDDRRMLVVGGALAGLAFLTRTFAGYLLPVAAIVLWRDGRGLRRRLAVWIGAAAAVIVALWPLVWVRPWKAASLLVSGAARGAVEDSDAGQFFLGFHFPAPGPMYYPVAVALRITIVTSVVGIAAVWFARRRRNDPDARTVSAFLLYGIGFLGTVSLTLKTADRYALPAIAALDLAVAIVLCRLITEKLRKAMLVPVLSAALFLHAGPALALHPYELAHYNWTVGGPIAAQRAIPIGRGEGLDEAAADLNRLPNASRLVVATTRLTGFEEFFAGRTISIEQSSLASPGGDEPDLVVFYISSVQVGRFADVWARFRNQDADYVLRINGIPYVRVYRV